MKWKPPLCRGALAHRQPTSEPPREHPAADQRGHFLPRQKSAEQKTPHDRRRRIERAPRDIEAREEKDHRTTPTAGDYQESIITKRANTYLFCHATQAPDRHPLT